MNRFARWCRFNLVGAAGMVLQLSLLALLAHVTPHYLLASVIAVEAAVIHNFTWHVHYTWRDRFEKSHWRKRLLRFHLSNGIISIAGNLFLMHVLVHNIHLGVLPSNALAIVCCSLLNFTVSDTWAFHQQRSDCQPSPALLTSQARPAGTDAAQLSETHFVQTCGGPPST